MKLPAECRLDADAKKSEFAAQLLIGLGIRFGRTEMSNFRKSLTTSVAALAVIAASTGAAEAKKKRKPWEKVIRVVVPIVVPGSAILFEPKPLSSAGLAAAVTPPLAPPSVKKTVEKGIDDSVATIEKAADDTVVAAKKAGEDIGNATVKAAHDVGDAGKAVGKFTERQVAAYYKSLEQAAHRMGEGKFVDAWWHLHTDQAKATESNAFKATQESNVIRIGAQIAATAYGGPSGAAAFAAWQAYKLSGGNLEAAIKAGVISGATSYLSGANAGMASETTKEIAKKIVIAGAIGGAAVAASGGSQADIQNAVMIGAASAGVQIGYERMMDGAKLDRDSTKASTKPAYCKLSLQPGEGCAPPKSAYQLDAQGKPVVVNGEPVTDVLKMDRTPSHVGMASGPATSPWNPIAERGVPMQAISKYPGMNAMAYFHDHIAATYGITGPMLQASIVPATVFTYYGTESPIMEAIRRTGERKLDRKEAKAEAANEGV